MDCVNKHARIVTKSTRNLQEIGRQNINCVPQNEERKRGERKARERRTKSRFFEVPNNLPPFKLVV